MSKKIFILSMVTFGLLIFSLFVTVETASACERRDPTASVSPSNQFGAPGNTRIYTATVTNNDTSGCSESTFSYSTFSCLSGWACSVSPTSGTLNPGSSQNISISITSASDASYGTYPFTFRARTGTVRSERRAEANYTYSVNVRNYSTPGSYTYTVPAEVGEIVIETWGGGGAGGGVSTSSSTTSFGAAGGGGGAYAKSTLLVRGGDTFSIVVGAGGAGVASGWGNDGASSFVGPDTNINNALVRAAAGEGGGAWYGITQPSGGAGGSVESSIGDTRIAGGDGSDGSSCSYAHSGSGGNGALGGAGGAGLSSGCLDGNPGEAPGGGGGGGFRTRLVGVECPSGGPAGGDGASGRVFITEKALVEYNLTIASGSGGSVVSPGEGTFSYYGGDVVYLEASADFGYRFVNWTGDTGNIANVTAAETSITMLGNYSINANFEKKDYELWIYSYQGGSVTAEVNGVKTEIDPEELVQISNITHGTVVDLEAIPDINYSFGQWLGDTGTIGNINSAVTTITMEDSYYIEADFETYSLTINSTSGGSVTTPGEGTFPYEEGTVVPLAATPASGYNFVNWTGNTGTIADVNAASTTITMNGNYSITANFAEEEPVLYSLTINSTSGGSVTTPGEGTFPYEEGTVVPLAATPASGYNFVNWTGNTGTIADVNAASTTITMNGNYSITANFAEEEVLACSKPSYYNATSLTGGTTGYVRFYDSDNCTNYTTERRYYNSNTSSWESWGATTTNFNQYTGYYRVSFSITSDTKYTHIQFRSKATESGYSDSVWEIGPSESIDHPTPQYNLIISSTDGGSVTDPGEGDHSYSAGTVVDLTAEAESGYQFVEWTDDIDTIADVNASTTTITMDNNYFITANFEKKDVPTSLNVEWTDHCRSRGLSIPRFSWEPEGVYEIIIIGKNENGEEKEFHFDNEDKLESDIYVFDNADWIKEYLPFGGHTYSWQVKVDGSAWVSDKFTTLSQAHPWVWPVSEGSRYIADQEVQLCSVKEDGVCDDALLSGREHWSECFSDPPDCDWEWDFGTAVCAESGCENHKNPLVIFIESGKDKKIGLKICDDNLAFISGTNGCCSGSLSLHITPPLPKWRETSPTI